MELASKADLMDSIFEVQCDLSIFIPMNEWPDEPNASMRNGVHRALRRAINQLENANKYLEKKDT